MSEGMAVFSGNCLCAICGEPAGFNDMHGNALMTGDIVIVFTEDDGEMDCFPDGLTVVVGGGWQSTNHGDRITHKRGVIDPSPFVMGFRSLPMNDDSEWRVVRVKKHSDAVIGEHWAAYGFSYQAIPDTIMEENQP